MLEPLQIMSGFKNIRTMFWTKCKIEKPICELALWFSLDKGILSVHDFEIHKTSMVLALRKSEDPSSWIILFYAHTSGEQLLKEAIAEDSLFPNQYLNREYRLTGFVPFRFLK